MNPLLLSSATELARRIRSGEVSSREVVEAHIARIERVNPALNAVVRARFGEARAEALAADQRKLRDRGASLPPFHGVPCTIKESFAVRGMPNTSGLVARAGREASADATAVARLRKAGAIALGVTNVSELCMWMESSNRVYGRTNNPYDPARICGGSSGGEGAIVGAGGSPFGLGADIGGSIRMPAFFNGVFGHKPTGGLVPGSGQFPIAHGPALRYLTTGPIARRAEDSMPLLRVLAGPDGEDTGCEPMTLGDPSAVSLEGLTVLDVAGRGISRELREAQVRAASALRERGAVVRKASFAALSRSFEIWASMLGSSGGPTFAELLGEGVRVRPLQELLRWSLGRSPHTLPSIFLALIEGVTRLSPARTARFVAMGGELRAEVAAAIGEGVMLYPSFPVTAPRHHRPLVPPTQWTHTAIMNVLEVPVTQVPLGLDRRGLPLGVQVVGAHGQDHRTIAVAMELERAFGGWTPPPSLV